MGFVFSRLWRLCPNLCSMQASTEASSSAAGFRRSRTPFMKPAKDGFLLDADTYGTS